MLKKRLIPIYSLLNINLRNKKVSTALGHPEMSKVAIRLNKATNSTLIFL